MRIKNINDMCDKPCRCGNWLEHWKNLSRLPLPSMCAAKSCDQIPVAGAFAQKDNYFDDGWFIVPLCQKHNRLFGACLDLKDGTVFVPAKASPSCITPGTEVPAPVSAPASAEQHSEATAVHYL
jgi:hypothetical protein